METTYTQARANFASLCDHATSTLEPVVIHRKGAEDVALVSAAELRSLQATLHELRLPTERCAAPLRFVSCSRAKH